MSKRCVGSVKVRGNTWTWTAQEAKKDEIIQHTRKRVPEV
jgi:hypothetical protein